MALPTTTAFGATCPYWSENPLTISPGEEKEISCILQNMLGGKDIKLKAEITSGLEIATLTDSNTEYIVPFGREDIKVNLKVKIPENPEKE